MTAPDDPTERARRLLDAATPGPWEWDGRDLCNRYDTVIEPTVECSHYCYGGTPRLGLNDADAALIAAAPDLAHTVIHLAAEVERLRQWKAEATEVIESWELVYEALGDVGNLGQPRSEAVLAEVLKMKSDHAALTRLLDAVGETTWLGWWTGSLADIPNTLKERLHRIAAAVEDIDREHER